MDIVTPAWVKDAVFYQIFPDRFARSDAVPKPANLVPWGSRPTLQGFQGGDLLGVVEKLDYLQDLGISALYLNPIFRSASTHRYFAHDFYVVDPLLGGNDALRRLVDEAHRRSMYVILDGVFNHTGRGFFQFNDILENGPHSPWIDWFSVTDWPLSAYDGSRPANYVAWVGDRALPKLNTDNPQVRAYIMGVAEFWLREYAIDGWRLDVPEEISAPGFWEEFRQRVKGVNPEAYIVGEIWGPAPDWLRGDRLDATMNYQFTSAITAFVGGDAIAPALVSNRSYAVYPGIDAPAFAARIEDLLVQTAWPVTQVQLNSLDTHDVPRLLSIVHDDRAALRLATLFQMCYPGAPCIYYGDEIALRGTDAPDRPHHDSDARWPFPWAASDTWDRDMRRFFQAAIALRRAHPALRRGRYETLTATGRCYAFRRTLDEEALLILLNAGHETVTLDLSASCGSTPLQPLLGAENPASPGAIDVPARHGAVYRQAPPAP